MYYGTGTDSMTDEGTSWADSGYGLTLDVGYMFLLVLRVIVMQNDHGILSAQRAHAGHVALQLSQGRTCRGNPRRNFSFVVRRTLKE